VAGPPPDISARRHSQPNPYLLVKFVKINRSGAAPAAVASNSGKSTIVHQSGDVDHDSHPELPELRGCLESVEGQRRSLDWPSSGRRFDIEDLTLYVLTKQTRLNTQALPRLNTQAHLPVRRIDRPGPRGKALMASCVSYQIGSSTMTTTDSTTNAPSYPADVNARRRTTEAKETKSAFKTTELIVFVLSVLGVLIAAAVTDNGDDGQGFGARSAWLYVTLLSIGYMISRGLAKAGSRQRDDA
jgi:hypothetical protein